MFGSRCTYASEAICKPISLGSASASAHRSTASWFNASINKTCSLAESAGDLIAATNTDQVNAQLTGASKECSSSNWPRRSTGSKSTVNNDE
jgi:hypothetical protein